MTLQADTSLTPEWYFMFLLGILPCFLWPFVPVFILVSIAYVLAYTYYYLWGNTYLKVEDKAVVITGCDSGFGYDLALLLDEAGVLVFAGCLDETGSGANFLRAQSSSQLVVVPLDVTKDSSVTAMAEQVKQGLGGRSENWYSWNWPVARGGGGPLGESGSGAYFLRAQSSSQLVVVPLDVTKDSSVTAMAEQVKQGLGGRRLWGLYNNAGISGAGEIEWTSVDVYKRIADVNLYGTMRVTRALLPLIRASRGRIVTITSGIARIPVPGRSAYTISKAATENYMEVLRYEMTKFGVRVSVICPGNLSGVTKIFASMDAMLKNIYKDLDADVRKDYGKAYLDAFHTRIFGYRHTGSTLSTKAVTNAVIHALFSAHPRYRYRPMTWDWLVWDTLLNVLPEDWKFAYFKWWFLPQMGMPKVPSK